jgi:hypothetical protein
MAYRQPLPVTTLRVASPQTSSPVSAQAGTEITMTIPDPLVGGTGTGTVEFSKSAQSDIQSGTAVWTTILSSSATIGPIKVYGDCWVRATCSAGSVSVAVDPMGQAISTSSGSFGVPIPVTASRDITDNDDGETLRPTTTLNLTLRVGRKLGLGFVVRPASGSTISIVSDGTVLLNGATTTLTRTAASNATFAVVYDGAANSYWVNGS